MIYVELLEEGVNVWRPVRAISEGNGVYRLPNEQPEGERWAFPPGARVACETQVLVEGGTNAETLVATRLADD
jgi:hypothetical protein